MLTLNVPPVPKVRKKKSYLEICNEKGWEIGICKDCRSALPLGSSKNCQRITIKTIKPAPRAPPYYVWRMSN